MESIASRLNVAKTAARKAGLYLKEQFGTAKALQLTYKGEIDIVTDCDIEAQRLIVDTLHEHYPEDDIIAEEGCIYNRVYSRSDCWIVDPLDGTTNFAHGFPHFCVSIAYQAGGEVCLGVVYAPVLDEMYSAYRSGGAYLDRAAIQVSRTDALREAVVSSGFPYNLLDMEGDNLREWAALTRQIRSPRCVGAAALDLCYVACGCCDAHWELDLDPWDMAAGSLIVAEAGGLVTDVHGRSFDLHNRSILASNHGLHAKILAVLSASASKTPAPSNSPGTNNREVTGSRT
jgi:myo-inositol-1(or 4)-monophosphatase